VARYVVLVRGVNVGGHNKLPMAKFRELLTGLGFTDVATYLQSGNAVITAARQSPAKLATTVERALKQELNLSVQVLAVTGDRLKRIVNDNPMVKDDHYPTHLYVAFMSGKPNSKALQAIDATRYAPDRFTVVGDVAYLHYPKGMGRSRLDPGVVFGRCGVWVTARNWRTVGQLLDLVAGG
jgi:uncharacterized protein (DUF1697 family)